MRNGVLGLMRVNIENCAHDIRNIFLHFSLKLSKVTKSISINTTVEYFSRLGPDLENEDYKNSYFYPEIWLE